jgi:hypothetical protein
METDTVPDGTETYEDSEGNSHTRTVYSQVTFEVFYNNCKVGVSNHEGNNKEYKY